MNVTDSRPHPPDGPEPLSQCRSLAARLLRTQADLGGVRCIGSERAIDAFEYGSFARSDRDRIETPDRHRRAPDPLKKTSSARISSACPMDRIRVSMPISRASSMMAARVIPGNAPSMVGGVTRVPSIHANTFATEASATFPCRLSTSPSWAPLKVGERFEAARQGGVRTPLPALTHVVGTGQADHAFVNCRHHCNASLGLGAGISSAAFNYEVICRL